MTFLLKPSVRIATTIMHGRPLRPGGAPDMTVQEAQFEMKGEFDAKKKSERKSESQKKGGKGKKPVVSQKEKLLSWSGFDDTHKASEVCKCCQCAAREQGTPKVHSSIFFVAAPMATVYRVWPLYDA